MTTAPSGAEAGRPWLRVARLATASTRQHPSCSSSLPGVMCRAQRGHQGLEGGECAQKRNRLLSRIRAVSDLCLAGSLATSAVVLLRSLYLLQVQKQRGASSCPRGPPRRRILNPVAHQAVSKGGTVPLGEVLPLASSLVGTEPSTPPLSANSHLGSTISKTRWSSPLTVATSGKRVHCPFCELPPRRWHSLTLCGPRFQPAPAKAAALSTTGQQRAV